MRRNEHIDTEIALELFSEDGSFLHNTDSIAWELLQTLGSSSMLLPEAESQRDAASQIVEGLDELAEIKENEDLSNHTNTAILQIDLRKKVALNLGYLAEARANLARSLEATEKSLREVEEHFKYLGEINRNLNR